MDERTLRIQYADYVLEYIKRVYKRRRTLKLNELYNILIRIDTTIDFGKKIVVYKRSPCQYNMYMSAYLKHNNADNSISQQEKMRQGAKLWKESENKDDLCRRFRVST